MTEDITTILQARGKWRGHVRLSDSILEKIEIIRGDVNSGEDAQGWNKVSTWRAGTGSSSSGGGGGGGGGRFGSRFAGNGGGYRRFGQGAAPATPHRPQTQPAPATYSRYVSQFRNSEDTVENVVVNTIIQGKLNKFSIANYDEVREFLMEILGSGEKDFLSDFMRLIFQKAATEPTFCPLYAKLLFELSSRFDFLRVEMDKLYRSFLPIFEEIAPEETTMEAFIQRNKEKKYRLGYSQFIGELYRYDIISTADLLSTIKTVFDQMHKLVRSDTHIPTLEEYADCILRLLRVLSADPAVMDRIASSALEVSNIATLTVRSPDLPGLTNKVRFAMMDAKKLLGA